VYKAETPSLIIRTFLLYMLLGQRSGANCGAWNPAGRIERTFGVAQKVRADTFYKAENIMFEGILSRGKRIRCCKVVTALELQYCSYNNQRKNCWEHIFWSVLPCCYSTNVILTSKLLCTSAMTPAQQPIRFPSPARWRPAECKYKATLEQVADSTHSSCCTEGSPLPPSTASWSVSSLSPSFP
jgi:hypothetical protein